MLFRSENSFDNVLCCFVWRNIDDTEKALSEVYRVLKPGGKFILLDMTRPKNSFLKLIHKTGTFILLHFVGLITLNLKEYSFLYKSLDFYPQPEVHLSKNNYTNLSWFSKWSYYWNDKYIYNAFGFFITIA